MRFLDKLQKLIQWDVLMDWMWFMNKRNQVYLQVFCKQWTL